MSDSEKFLVREIINQESIKEMTERLVSSYSDFNGANFQNDISSVLSELEYKQRVVLIANKLKEYLPSDYPQALRILTNSLPQELPNEEDFGINRFYLVGYSQFVMDNGLDFFDISMEYLLKQTKCFTAEFGIRIFLDKYPKESIELVKQWTQSDNIHVRRLCSEGIRPRLPWALQLKNFITDPSLILEVLELLKSDSEMYVRRSVANNLNDISKNHSELVIKTLKEWQDNSDEINWLTNHALRTLIKKGNKDALELIGYPASPIIEINNFISDKDECNIGASIYFSFEIKSEAKQNLLIDYIVNFVKSNGKLSSKVFKLSKKSMAQGEVINIKKKQSFSNFTTRKIYAGLHSIELQINGAKYGEIFINVGDDNK